MVMAAAQKVPNKKKALTKKQSAGAAKVPKPSKEVLKKQTKVLSGTNVAERMPKKMKSPDKPNVRKRPAALKNKIVWKTWPIEFTGVEGGLLYKWKLLGLWLNYK